MPGSRPPSRPVRPTLYSGVNLAADAGRGTDADGMGRSVDGRSSLPVAAAQSEQFRPFSTQVT
jgi:hypothetical protein